MTSFLCSCTATQEPWRATHRSMLATTAAMDGFDTLPAPGWFTSAPKTIVGACFSWVGLGCFRFSFFFFCWRCFRFRFRFLFSCVWWRPTQRRREREKKKGKNNEAKRDKTVVGREVGCQVSENNTKITLKNNETTRNVFFSMQYSSRVAPHSSTTRVFHR